MDNSGILVDTSVIIDYLRKQNRERSILFTAAKDYTLYVSAVTEFELCVGATSDEKYGDVQSILSFCTVLVLASDVARQAALIYQTLRKRNQILEIRDNFYCGNCSKVQFASPNAKPKTFRPYSSSKFTSAAVANSPPRTAPPAPATPVISSPQNNPSNGSCSALSNGR